MKIDEIIAVNQSIDKAEDAVTTKTIRYSFLLSKTFVDPGLTPPTTVAKQQLGFMGVPDREVRFELSCSKKGKKKPRGYQTEDGTDTEHCHKQVQKRVRHAGQKEDPR